MKHAIKRGGLMKHAIKRRGLMMHAIERGEGRTEARDQARKSESQSKAIS